MLASERQSHLFQMFFIIASLFLSLLPFSAMNNGAALTPPMGFANWNNFQWYAV